MKRQLPVHRFAREFDPAVREMMDRPDADAGLLAADLRNLRVMNRWLGAHRLIRAEMEILFADRSPNGGESAAPLTILDFCTGSADIPRVIVDWCRGHSVRVQVTATDLNPFMLDEARALSKGHPEISFERADILHPDFSDRSHDLVMCNLALHHFQAVDAIRALEHMWRIARRAVLVNDLHRSRTLCMLAERMVPRLTSNPITRFDAALSARRAFTWDEMFRLASHARIPAARIHRYLLGRQVLVAIKEKTC